jgi:hypothetical protein
LHSVDNVLNITGGGNVGIGTTTPTAKLEIGNAGTYSILAGNARIGNVATPFSATDAATKGYVDGLTGASANFWGGTKNGNIWNGDAGVGNVGIGVTNPNYKLEVAGLARFASQALTYGAIEVGGYYSAGSTYWTGKIVGDYYGNQYNANVAHGMSFIGGRAGFDNFRWFKSDYTELMTLTNSGNLGIGTTAPTSKLTISGLNYDIINGPHVTFYTNADSYPLFQQFNWGHNNIALNFDSYYNGSAWVSSSNLNNYQIYKANGSLNFNYANAVNAGTTFSWSPGIILNSSGNVGIGTTTPTAKLEIGGAGTYGFLAGNARIGNVAAPFAATDAATKGYVDGLTGASTNFWGGTKNGVIWNGDAGVGSVGIGLTNPATKFHIYGANESLGGLIFQNSTYSATPAAGGLFMGQRNDGGLQIDRYGQADLLDINVNGNVGIGTTNPAGPLNIAKAAGDNLIYADNYSTTGGNSNYWFSRRSHSNTNGTLATTLTGDAIGTFFFQGVNTSNAFAYGAKIIAQQNGAAGTYVPTDLNFSTYSATAQNSNQLVLSTNGNVGIGTTTPGYRLDVIGEARVNNLRIPNTTNGGITDVSGTAWIYPRNSSNNLHIRTASGGIYIDTDNDVNFRKTDGTGLVKIMSASGNVGIGTTTPTAKLEIGGAGTYALLASSARIGNVATPFSAADAATKGYVDGLVSVNLWSGTRNGNVWNGDAGVGNIGIGTTAPKGRLNVLALANSANMTLGAATQPGLSITSSDSGQYGMYFGVNSDGNSWMQGGRTDSATAYNISLQASGGNVGIGTTNPIAKLHVAGGMVLNRTAVADTAYTVLVTDYMIGYTSLTANRTLTLPTALCTSGRTFIVTNETSSAFSVIIDPEGATTISGNATISLSAYNSTPVYCNGSNWFIY